MRGDVSACDDRALALMAVGCSNGQSVDESAAPSVALISTTTAQAPTQPAEVKLIGERDFEVTLTGRIAAEYAGKIREAWNVQRDADGVPSITGDNGSAGPLDVPTSDEAVDGDLLVSTFEHGKVTFDTKTGAVEVTVNDRVVPSGLLSPGTHPARAAASRCFFFSS